MTNPSRCAVLTGASTGIGRALAVRLAQDGWHCALLARRPDALAETARLVDAAGGTATVTGLDLADARLVTAAADQLAASLPSLDLIANVAGVWHDAEKAYQGPLLHETPSAQISEVMNVGALAPLLLSSALLRRMITARRGHVINVSGTFSSGGAGWLHYFVSKKAIEAFTVALAQELRRFEIQVNCISPADVATEEYKRFYPQYAAAALPPADVADFAVSLMAPSNRHITGQIIELRNRTDHE